MSISNAGDIRFEKVFEWVLPVFGNTDDWGEGMVNIPWESVYGDEKCEALAGFKKHRRKYKHTKEGFNRRWKQYVTFGRWIARDK